MQENDRETLGGVVSTRRKELGFTQKQVAQSVVKEDGTPITPQFLNDVERNRRRPSPLVLQRLAEALKWSGEDADRLHYIARTLPPDIDLENVARDQWADGIKAFRRA
jgi:transcriptional regulator with XRE-family HTH domain